MASSLAQIRKLKKVSLRQLGAAIQLTHCQLSRIERGESRPSAKTAQRIFEYFEGSITREQLMFPEIEAHGKKPSRSARVQEAQ